jgi:hypothetical protein
VYEAEMVKGKFYHIVMKRNAPFQFMAGGIKKYDGKAARCDCSQV